MHWFLLISYISKTTTTINKDVSSISKVDQTSLESTMNYKGSLKCQIIGKPQTYISRKNQMSTVPTNNTKGCLSVFSLQIKGLVQKSSICFFIQKHLEHFGFYT